MQLLKYEGTHGEVAFGIVVFREVYYETVAYRSLQESILNLKGNVKYNIYIYDNTDKIDWLVNEPNLTATGIEISYYHNYQNPGISTAYNFMAMSALKEGMKWMVFMDQDTCLPLDAVVHYVQSIKSNMKILLKAPSIRVMGKQFSPAGFRMMRAFSLKNELQTGVYPLKNLTIINSCLMVNLSFFKSINGYDERLRLDFADTEFIERAKTVISKFELLPFSCSHNFSNNSSSTNSSLFRFKIYVQDLVKYPAKNSWQRIQLMFVGFVHTLQLSWRFHSLKFLNVWIKKLLF